MTAGRNTKIPGRFGALVSCLRALGSPKEILISLVGPKISSLPSTKVGFSISNGNRVVLLDWSHKVDLDMIGHIRSHVMDAMNEEETRAPGFGIPEVSDRLYYIYSGS